MYLLRLYARTSTSKNFRSHVLYCFSAIMTALTHFCVSFHSVVQESGLVFPGRCDPAAVLRSFPCVLLRGDVWAVPVLHQPLPDRCVQRRLYPALTLGPNALLLVDSSSDLLHLGDVPGTCSPWCFLFHIVLFSQLSMCHLYHITCHIARDAQLIHSCHAGSLNAMNPMQPAHSNLSTRVLMMFSLISLLSNHRFHQWKLHCKYHMISYTVISLVKRFVAQMYFLQLEDKNADLTRQVTLLTTLEGGRPGNIPCVIWRGQPLHQLR